MGCNGCGITGLVASFVSAARREKQIPALPRMYVAQLRQLQVPIDPRFTYGGGLYSPAGLNGNILLVGDVDRPGRYDGGNLAANFWFENSEGRSDALQLSADLAAASPSIEFVCRRGELALTLFRQSAAPRRRPQIEFADGKGGTIVLVPFQG